MSGEDLRAVAARIRLLVLDVDGVLTDGRLHYDADGREFKSFHVRDGYGMQELMKAGIPIAVISGRGSGSAAGRLADLKVPHVFLARPDKQRVLDGLLTELHLDIGQVACVGDDVPDLPLIERAALGVAVADAHAMVVRAADWITAASGGKGAVREVCDLLLEAHRGRSA
jgi:3-deoxy-D-manno-octulosonate 8-phosphate phosphatase (KDO 8-P phosphatase)